MQFQDINKIFLFSYVGFFCIPPKVSRALHDSIHPQIIFNIEIYKKPHHGGHIPNITSLQRRQKMFI